MVEDGEFAACARLEAFQHLAELYLGKFLHSIFDVPQFVAEEGELIEILVEFVPLLEQWSTDDFVEVEIPGLEGLVDAGDSMHLVVMGAVDEAAFTAGLLADLAEERGGFLVVRAETW